jgi:hypothetical protein
MKIGNRQEFGGSGLYPIFSFVALTFGAMAVAAGIVTDVDFSASITSINMASKCGSSASFYC